MKSFRIFIVQGRVQGVYFRQSTREKAEELGVTGFVQNLENGDVYVEAEGSPSQLDALEAWCHKGPPRAQVVAVHVTVGQPKGYTDFKVLR